MERLDSRGERFRILYLPFRFPASTSLIIFKKNTEPEPQYELMVNHMQELRKRIPGMRAARIVFIPESNLAFEGTHQANAIKKSGLKNVCIMREDDNRAGVRTNESFKKTMAIAFKEKLTKRKVFFNDNMVTLSPKVTPDDLKKELMNELTNYTRIIKESRDVYVPPKELYSGKNGYGFDDMVIALTMNLVMKRRFYANSKDYGKFH
jgi:hypothetical protein